MQVAASRWNAARVATWCVIAAAAVVAIRNATVYPAVAGYDAREALDYATSLVQDGRLPQATGSYYTPPGFFAVGGVGIELGQRLGLDHPSGSASSRTRPQRSAPCYCSSCSCGSSGQEDRCCISPRSCSSSCVLS
jgi:hypothetical protein